MSKLILTRHGQSIWNAENKFTGWVDVDLSKKGILEAEKSGQLIKGLSINIDVSFTSFLKRAIKTLTTILKINELELKFNTSWEMNERHYGSLTGLNKEETENKIGAYKFKTYRRSWDIAPPPMPENDKNNSLFSPLNVNIPIGMIPFTESLKDTYNRVIPYYKKEIEKNLLDKKILWGDFHRLLAARVNSEKLKIVQFETNHRARKHGESNYGFSRIFKIIIDLIYLNLFHKSKTRNFYFIGFLGLISLALSFISVTYMLILKIFKDVSFIETPLPILSVLFTISFLIFFALLFVSHLITILENDNTSKKDDFEIFEK